MNVWLNVKVINSGYKSKLVKIIAIVYRPFVWYVLQRKRGIPNFSSKRPGKSRF